MKDQQIHLIKRKGKSKKAKSKSEGNETAKLHTLLC
jgi:hypothetical protein